MIIAGYTYVTHKLIPRPWGPECRYTVKDSNDQFIDDVVPIKSMDISQTDLIQVVTDRLRQMKDAKDYEDSFDKRFDDIGVEVKEALHWLVRKIRQFPNATLVQAETAWNAEWADSIFTFQKLITFMRNKIDGITWDNFKTYVINHRFRGLD
jgi:hypothetical protein